MNRKLLLTVNWGIFIVLALLIVIIINMAISASYYPNAPSSPYFSTVVHIWTLAIFTSFLLSILLTFNRDNLSVQEILSVSTLVYGILITYIIIKLILVKPVPLYFIQVLGNTKYQVPSEFVFTGGSSNGIRIDLCLQTLKGIYSLERDCDYQSVNLSTEPINSSLDAQFFFEQVKEFQIKGNQVIILNSAKKYQIYLRDNFRGYTIGRQWVSPLWRQEVETMHKKEFPNIPFDFQESIPIHLVISDQNELMRFVTCQNNYKCEHYIKTTKGVLNYELKGSVDFDFERWYNTDRRILNLISDWKVD